MKDFVGKKILFLSIVLCLLICPLSAGASGMNQTLPAEETVLPKDSLQQEKSLIEKLVNQIAEKYDCVEYDENGEKQIEFKRIPFVKNHPLSKKYLLYPLGLVISIFILLRVVKKKQMVSKDLDCPSLRIRMLLCVLFIILFVLEIVYFFFPLEASHMIYFIMPSEVGWLMTIVNFFLMIGLVVGQLVAFRNSCFLLHKNRVPAISASIIVLLSVLGWSISYGFDIKYLQEHLFTYIEYLMLLQILIIIFYNIREKQPIQIIVEIPFFVIGLLSITMFIGTALALIGAILLVVVVILLIFTGLPNSFFFPPRSVYSIITNEKIKDQVDEKCKNCTHLDVNHNCRLKDCDYQPIK